MAILRCAMSKVWILSWTTGNGNIGGSADKVASGVNVRKFVMERSGGKELISLPDTCTILVVPHK